MDVKSDALTAGQSSRQPCTYSAAGRPMRRANSSRPPSQRGVIGAPPAAAAVAGVSRTSAGSRRRSHCLLRAGFRFPAPPDYAY